jgi:outer membrane protein OmpA-like peptidoglycan-associated protein
VLADDRRPLAAPAIRIGSAPEQPPVANPVVLPAAGAGFVFDATLSIDPEGLAPAPGVKAEHGLAAGIRSVLWNFGDGTTSTKPVLTKTYARPGAYHVTLRVTDAAGRTATSGQTVSVARAGSDPAARPRPRNIRIPSLILFDFGADRLRPESRVLLQRVAKVVRRGVGGSRVVGHTDAIGPAAFNLTLSRERARVVRSYLVRPGRIAPKRLHAIGRGEVRPLASNRTERGRQLNRRVVIRLRLPSVGFSRI